MTAGDPSLWSELFPGHLVPEIIDLVLQTWKSFSKPAPNDLEVPITRRFKHSLKQAKNYRRLPVRIEREPAEDDPKTGEELGRIDLKFAPAQSALEEVYFAFECKRLNVLENGKRRTLAAEYVADGMMRFVTGQYSGSVLQGAMIGYVLDGHSEDAIRLVSNNVMSRAIDLKLLNGTGLDASSIRPDLSTIRETQHAVQPSRLFHLHHLFLSCVESECSVARSVSDFMPYPE